MTDVFDDLDAQTLEAIGDEIVYTPSGGAALNIKAWVNHNDQAIQFGNSAAITGDASIQVRVIDVAQPTKADIIDLPRTGLSYRPASIMRDRSGRLWNITLKRNV